MAAPDAVGRVARGADHQRGVLGRVHHGDEQRLRTHVQVLLDQRHVAHHRAYHRLHGVGRNSAQLVEHGAGVVGGVLAVEQQPVEAAAGQGFGHVGIGKADPAADDLLACLQGLFERIDWE